MTFLDLWPQELHDSLPQIKSRNAAKKIKASDITMNQDGSCEVSGSGPLPYHVTLSSCTCQDFVITKHTKSPCKHIYRLASELGQYQLLPAKNSSGAKAVKVEIQRELEFWKQQFEAGSLPADKYIIIFEALAKIT